MCFMLLNSACREGGENVRRMRWFDWQLFEESRVYVMVFLGLNVLGKVCIPHLSCISVINSPNGMELSRYSRCRFRHSLDVTVILTL